MDMSMKSEADIQREKDDNDALETMVNIDGHKLKLRDVFPDAYAAREFRTKLKLLRSRASGEPDGMDDKMQEEVIKKTAEDLDDELFGAKRKQEKNPIGMNGE
jgi:hypothetical protein